MELTEFIKSKTKFCISIGGESGCGKGSLACTILKDLKKQLALTGFFFHGDDCFKLPPKDNQNARVTNYDFFILEGAYASLLKNPDYKIFINLSYIDMKKNRLIGTRDIMNVFNEQIFYIEHCLIKEHYKRSKLIIDNQLNIKIQ